MQIFTQRDSAARLAALSQTVESTGCGPSSSMTRTLRCVATALAVMALLGSIALLASDAPLGMKFSAPAISAAPLLLIGVSFLIAQPILRPRRTELLKNVLLAAAFILWGIVQLMAQNRLSRSLGDVVIALYVLDLAWVTLASVKPAP
jgi:hypothetical protein